MNQNAEKTYDSAKSLNRLTKSLIDYGVIDEEALERALMIQTREPRTAKRRITDILIEDLNIDRNAVFKQIVQLYGFQTIHITDETVDQDRIDFIKNILKELSESVSNQLLKKSVLPFKWHEFKKNVLVMVAADPTDKEVHDLAKGKPILQPELIDVGVRLGAPWATQPRRRSRRPSSCWLPARSRRLNSTRSRPGRSPRRVLPDDSSKSPGHAPGAGRAIIRWRFREAARAGRSGGSAWESNPPVRQTTDTPVLKTGRPTGAYPLPQIASYLTPPAVK